jgi:hypothetical protein
MTKGKLPCFTSFTDEDASNYRAHPYYDGKAWNDYAMIEWEGYPQHEPVFIHTFVDLRGIPEGDTIDINSNGKMKLEAGLYAVAYSFDPIDKGDHTPHFHSPNDRRPTLYLVDVESIRLPILGIPDVPFGAKPPKARAALPFPDPMQSRMTRCVGFPHQQVSP